MSAEKRYGLLSACYARRRCICVLTRARARLPLGSGGIPLIWPQFSNRGALPSHGFARVSDGWRVASQDEARVVLVLEDSEVTRKVWPFEFVARYTVELLHDGLRLEFEGDTKPFAFHILTSRNPNQCYPSHRR